MTQENKNALAAKIEEMLGINRTEEPQCTCEESSKQRALCPVCDKEKYEEFLKDSEKLKHPKYTPTSKTQGEEFTDGWSKGDIVLEEGGYIGEVLDIYVLNFEVRLLTNCSSNTPYWAKASHFTKVKNIGIYTEAKDKEIERLRVELANKMADYEGLGYKMQKLTADSTQSYSIEQIEQALSPLSGIVNVQSFLANLKSQKEGKG